MSAIFAFLTWMGLPTGSALTAAVMPVVHERIRAERFSMMFWLRIVMTLAALPVLLFTGMPDDPVFYIATLVTAVIWSYADLSSFRATEEFGAGPVTRFIPLNVIVTFFMWMAVEPGLLEQYRAQPLIALGLTASIAAAVFCAMRMQPYALSRAAMRALAPIVIMSGMGVVFAKLALDHAGTSGAHAAVFGYIVLQSLAMVLVFGALEAVKHPVPRAIFTGPVAIQAGIIMGLNSVVHLVCKAYAYRMVENPAYVSVIILTTPLWVLLYYRLVRKQAVGDLRPAFAVLVCALLAAVFALLLHTP